jgi:hypothetical protein
MNIIDYWKSFLFAQAQKSFINTAADIIRNLKLSRGEQDKIFWHIFNTGVYVDLNKAKKMLADYVEKYGKKRF